MFIVRREGVKDIEILRELIRALEHKDRVPVVEQKRLL